ncbi:hypothetical protein PUN28_013561 [Cardiocondyla obscurior]|uniref:Uncharacterized protein n=1 Tax=Cardiocondyla obscurior TaxID=286306 RepID=A0AAW2F702_9HYME
MRLADLLIFLINRKDIHVSRGINKDEKGVCLQCWAPEARTITFRLDKTAFSKNLVCVTHGKKKKKKKRVTRYLPFAFAPSQDLLYHQN